MIHQAEQASADPRARLERLTTIAGEGFNVQLELALRDWARRDSVAGRVMEEVDGRRVDYMRQLLREVGLEPIEVEARAFLLYSALLGDALLPADHGRFSRKRVMRESVAMLLAKA